ncbi:MAG: BON domain-containing protein [Synergistaceae bacterium]|nr:BON domain-containing protein [Synergistaceae bacterium]
MTKTPLYTALAVLLLVLLPVHQAAAFSQPQKTFHLETGENAPLSFSSLTRVAIGNPNVLDAQPVSRNELLLFGKSEGVSSLVVWDSKGCHRFDILVHPSRRVRTWDLERILQCPGIKVVVTDTSVILEGTVRTPYDKRRAEAIAKGFAPNVVNLLNVEGDPRVKIEAIVMEMAKGNGQKLGLSYLEGGRGQLVSGSANLINSELGQIGFTWNRTADIASNLKGLFEAVGNTTNTRILSRPSVSGLSGERAFINVGGEIPVPVGVENNQVKIEWKPYGVIMTIVPEVLGDGDILLNLSAEVSELDWDNRIVTNGVSIPALRSRKVENRTVLKDGEPLVIGGLLDNKQTRMVKKIPFLADLPLLGSLFRSKQFQNNETELVITVVPQVVKTP